jgi:hypothetical protein
METGFLCCYQKVNFGSRKETRFLGFKLTTALSNAKALNTNENSNAKAPTTNEKLEEPAKAGFVYVAMGLNPLLHESRELRAADAG